MLNQLQAMRIFLRVAENNSFSRAASSLNLSNAVVTRYVALLEAHLDARLVNRTTRSVSLTEAGRVYARGCQQLMELLDSMESAVTEGAGEPTGTLKVAASASFSLAALAPLLHRYRMRHPKVKLDITLLHDTVDLVEEGFDVGIVASWQVNGSTLVKRPLLSVRPVMVASPGYTDRYGAPTSLEQLATHSFLAPSRDMHGADWSFASTDGREETLNLDSVCKVNSMIMLRQLVLADMGVAILPEDYVAGDIANGALLPVLAQYRVTNGHKELSLVYPGRRHVAAKVRTFVDFTVEYFRRGFAPVAPRANVMSG
ncbi:LysR family transcriptional regulator [Burkholderia sp. Ac-20365]|jgi:DNA-binding transcriptional LysR family regulator|nr:LysR family transcriptional regulator [Burkholderia sp. Ac-20365]MBN3759709.1 LysR family transcriptional regulator [Burkholderia sp. Ac-20365]